MSKPFLMNKSYRCCGIEMLAVVKCHNLSNLGLILDSVQPFIDKYQYYNTLFSELLCR